MSLALYRKYRPRSFSEIIGQEHVTEPLSQALRTGRLHHAYLFSGPRGCGKTSSARILARSLNCAKGPTPDPCGECDSCRALAPDGAGSIDVIEIDAASHGGVDDARDLRERAFFAPVSSRFKVYVIDEAHMVSSAGFNALLKLVEEPPDYVKFVFATTEPEKVLGTIKSRTHHYPFRLIPPAILRPYLEQLCVAEGVAVQPAVFPLVLSAGGGSARDSLSILDQLIAGAGEEGVTYARAVALLGVTDAALIDEMCDALAAGDGATAFATIDRVADAGHDPRRFAGDLLERLRDLIVLQQVPDAIAKGLLNGADDELARMSVQAERFGAATVSRMADIVHTGLVDMRGTTAPRLVLELITARMLLPGAEDSTGALLQRLERMERRLTLAGDDGPPAATDAAPSTPTLVRVAPPAASSAPSPAGPVHSSVPAPAVPPSGRASSGPGSSGPGSSGPGSGSTDAPVASAAGGGYVTAGAESAGAATALAAEGGAGVPSVAPTSTLGGLVSTAIDGPGSSAANSAPGAPQAARSGGFSSQSQVAGAATGAAGNSSSGNSSPDSSAPAGATSNPPGAATRPVAHQPGAIDAAAVRRIWDEVLTMVRRKSPRAAAVVREATVRDVDGNVLVLLFKHAFHAQALAASPELLLDAVYEVVGGRWQVRCEVAGQAGAITVPDGAASPTSASPTSASLNSASPTSAAPDQSPAAYTSTAVPATGRPPATRSSAVADAGSAPRGAVGSSPRPTAHGPTADASTGAVVDDDDWPIPATLGGAVDAPDMSDPDTAAARDSRSASGGGRPAASSASATGGSPTSSASVRQTPPGRPAASAQVAGSGRAAARAVASGRGAPGSTPAGRPARGRDSAGTPRSGGASGREDAWAGGGDEPPYDPEFDAPVTAASGYVGFDPGDEPDDDVDDATVRRTSEQQALDLLRQTLGAERIGEVDVR